MEINLSIQTAPVVTYIYGAVLDVVKLPGYDTLQVTVCGMWGPESEAATAAVDVLDPGMRRAVDAVRHWQRGEQLCGVLVGLDQYGSICFIQAESE